MKEAVSRNKWNFIIAIGCLWGLSEAAMGMYLRGACSRFITGSIMTGGAIFFMASAQSFSKKMIPVLAVLGIAAGFKLLDAALLGLPVLHGAIGNPIFAFYTEIFAFLMIFALMDRSLRKKHGGRALLGGLSALVAVNLFPLVRFATGVPACVVPGTGYPLALYYAPIAVGLSAVTCPLGMAFGEKWASLSARESSNVMIKKLVPVSLRFVPLICLALILLIRLG